MDMQLAIFRHVDKFNDTLWSSCFINETDNLMRKVGIELNWLKYLRALDNYEIVVIYLGSWG